MDEYRKKLIEEYRESLPSKPKSSLKDKLAFLMEDLKIVLERIPSADEVDNRYVEGGSYF